MTRHLYLGVVLAHVTILATIAASEFQVFQPIECNKEGGFLVYRTCVCNYGYTGHKCDVTLVFEETEIIEEAKSQRDTKIHAVESQPLFQYNERFKRQSDMFSGSGSGEEPVTSAPVTNSTMTPSPTVSCKFPQVFNGNECSNASRYSLMITIDQNFNAQFNNRTSTEFLNFTTTLTDFIKRVMNGTGLIDVTITQLRNGSIVATGDVAFEEKSPPRTSPDITILLQERLRGVNSTFDFQVISAQDIDECETADVCSNGLNCENTDGSFLCVCETGSTIDSTTGNCTSPCDVTTCNNGGECVVIGNGIAICSCPDGYSGPQCATAINTWINAVIALAVILGFILLVIIGIFIFICVRRMRKKKRSHTLPLVTGFRSTAEPRVMGGFDNPNNVEVEELKPPFQIEHMSHATNIKSSDEHSRPISMSTFRPPDDAVENEEDKL